METLIEQHIKSVAKTGIPVLFRRIAGDNRWMLPAPEGYQGTIYDNGLVYEHRLIMEYFLGRTLGKDEIVHHKDGNKLNNKIENLELMSRADHTAYHIPDPEMVTLLCEYCGTTFLRRKNKSLKGYEHTFCSLSHSVKFQMKERYKTSTIKHGTQSGYRHGCRCIDCKLFHNERIRKFRDSKKKGDLGV